MQLSENRPDAVPVLIVDINPMTAKMIAERTPKTLFSETFGNVPTDGSIVGAGDALDVSVWEAPPAVLFGSSFVSTDELQTVGGPSNTDLPQQTVSAEGTINVPFAGLIHVVGRTEADIGKDIRARLQGKAHDPQVLVRIVRNATRDVTMVGEFANNMRLPLTAKGERVLDAVASAGGVRQPVDKVTIQLTRGSNVEAMALAAIIRDPKQNVRLASNDVLTALFQPYSFTVLGEAGMANVEIDRIRHITVPPGQ